MFPNDVISGMAQMCRHQGIKFIQGEFKAFRDSSIDAQEEEGCGVVKCIVNDRENYVMWFMDSEHGVLTGVCRTPKTHSGFAAGSDISAEKKKEIIATLMAELWEE